MLNIEYEVASNNNQLRGDMIYRFITRNQQIVILTLVVKPPHGLWDPLIIQSFTHIGEGAINVIQNDMKITRGG